MNIGWYFSDDLSPSDELVDKFADSKFSTDKWTSFAREIIQNSLDAHNDDNNDPVEVSFDLNKELGLADIPGGERTRAVLSKCMEAATNKQTKNSYSVGLDVLNREKVYCMKISDKNTNGVKTGREEAWGAFVFDEGKSIKQRPGSAGSHGVGKKVPFIISSCNTVFYSTKNKYVVDGVKHSDSLLQGKTMLISWTDDDGKRKNSKGWYGVIDEFAEPKNKINPIYGEDAKEINPYFVRKDDYGTDVIIVGVNIYDKESEVKSAIINAVLENFFVAILRKKLVVKVFDEIIDDESFEKVFKKYYRASRETMNGLESCLRVFQGDADESRDIYDKEKRYLGRVDIYFGLGNENNKKYYTVVREHGMRITDYRLQVDQPYTAIVLIEGKELNELLSLLENAAHDQFVTEDENMEISSEAKYALNQVRKVVADYINEMTKIDSNDGQTIDGLNEIIMIPGTVSSIKRTPITPAKKKKKNKGGGGGGTHPSVKVNGPIYENFSVEPVFIKGKKEYILRFALNDDIKVDEMKFMSVNSDGKEDNTVADFLESVKIGRSKYKVVEGSVRNLSFKKNEVYTVALKLKRDITYQLTFELHMKSEVLNE